MQIRKTLEKLPSKRANNASLVLIISVSSLSFPEPDAPQKSGSSIKNSQSNPREVAIITPDGEYLSTAIESIGLAIIA